MSFHLLAVIAFWCALIPALLFCWNLFFFRRPPRPDSALPPVSILIPARNEESNIAAALESALATTGIDFELIVLDDGSTDHTAAIVTSFSRQNTRVRLEHGPALRDGWAGKAHAAHVLSTRAAHPLLCFLDADVRVTPAAIARMATLLVQNDAALVSGFPQQDTVTTLEWMLLPLIHFLLLCYLPLIGLRYTRLPAFGAGCGQFLLMRRDAYAATGGYASVPSTMHDGLLLPTHFRRHRYRTGLADLTGLAHCRMYRSFSATWHGLLKNATEGLAAPARIVPFTVLLLAGSVLPWLLGLAALVDPMLLRTGAMPMVWAACLLSLLPRIVAIPRFRQSLAGAVFHPASIVLLLVLQWYALARKLLGIKVTWKERAFRVG